MLTNEYSPSKTIMLEPLTMPQMLENTANPAEAQTDNNSRRRSRAARPEDTEQDIAVCALSLSMGDRWAFDRLSPRRAAQSSQGGVRSILR